jgi:hypothetical protein
MAVRPLAFGVRLRDKRRTLEVRKHDRSPETYEVVEARDGRETRRRSHSSLVGALGDAAASWRKRLH